MVDGPATRGGPVVERAPSGGSPTLEDCGILRFKGCWISLSQTQEAVVSLLVERFGEPVSRKEIIERVWPGEARDRHTIDIHIYRLRPRLLGIGLVVHTLRGRGFLLEEAPEK